LLSSSDHVVGLPQGQTEPFAERHDMFPQHRAGLAVDDFAVAAAQ